MTHQLVFRFSLVPSLMGSHDGPLGIRHPPNINAAFTFHCSLFRVDCANALFQSWCKHSVVTLDVLLIPNDLASKHDPNSDLCYHATGMLALVLGQLFPNGFKWSSTRHNLWSSACGGVDDRVRLRS